ncbi:hypothetical protein Syun_017905 [Stephania yunnanensis]|uniref:Uncharacterized protein n=1 Tax=Stephania yunnanensis TaxID=152371 RepID=A0AAP0JA41_9MAGN
MFSTGQGLVRTCPFVPERVVAVLAGAPLSPTGSKGGRRHGPSMGRALALRPRHARGSLLAMLQPSEVQHLNSMEPPESSGTRSFARVLANDPFGLRIMASHRPLLIPSPRSPPPTTDPPLPPIPDQSTNPVPKLRDFMDRDRNQSNPSQIHRNPSVRSRNSIDEANDGTSIEGFIRSESRGL